MLIEEKAIIIAAKQFKETSFIVKCFFENSGLIVGLYKAKKGKYIQKPIIGSIIYAKWQARLEEHLGYLSYENITNIPSLISCDKTLLLILDSALSLINLLILEKEPSNHLFKELDNLLQNLIHYNGDEISILANYIKFELFGLLTNTGFGLDLSKCIVTNTTQNLEYISPRSAAAVSLEIGKPYESKLFKIPKFLLSDSNSCTVSDLKEAYRISSYFLNKHILVPFDTKLPLMRKLLQEKVVNYQ